MIENLLVALNAVIPMFFIIGLGYYIRLKKMVDETELRKFNNLAFRIFLPCQLFKNVFDSELQDAINLKLMVFTICCVLFIYALAFAGVLLIEKKADRRGVMIQSIFRSNFVLLGIPLVTSIYNVEQLGAVPVMVAIIVPLFNILAVITLEIFRNSQVNIRRILKGIIKNPLILGSMIGLLAKWVQFPFYDITVISTTISYLAQIATPLMLFILGASFHFSSIRSTKKQLIFCCTGKLLISPAIAFFLAKCIGLHGIELAVLLGVFASPPAANSYNMAQQMGGDADLAANLVVVGTAVSCITLFGWILILKQFGMM